MAASDLGLAELGPLLQPLAAALPRLGAAVLVMPLLPKAVVSLPLRASFVVVLAMIMYPTYEHRLQGQAWTLPWLMGFALKEALIGAFIGYALGLFIWVLACIGELIDVQAGFSNAQIFDPFSGHSGGPMAALLGQTGMLLFVALGGLQVFLQLVYESVLWWPPEQLLPPIGEPLRDLAIGTSGNLLEWTVRWASPVIGALVLVELGVGLVNRSASQFNAFYFSMVLKGVVAVLVVALMLAHLVDVLAVQIGASRDLLPALHRAWGAR